MNGRLIFDRDKKHIRLQQVINKLTIEKYNKLSTQMEAYINQMQVVGIQKVEGQMINIPAIANDYVVKFCYDRKIYITGITFNQTGWKKEDQWSLLIDEKKILDHVSIKEIGEHKYFEQELRVNADAQIKFVLHNKSGNSRQLWVDLEYLDEGLPVPQCVNDIPNEWDIAVVMQWEANSSVDMDLYGVVGNKCVWYNHKDVDTLHLNFDYAKHLDNQSPEIMSVAGHKDQTLKVYINNYNGAILRDEVEVTIVSRDAGKVANTLKIYKVAVDANAMNAHYICEINLNTHEVIDKGSIINVNELRK